MLRASDMLRRSAGAALDQLKWGPVETEWEATGSEPGYTLRGYYSRNSDGPPVLIVPAPIKRPYIFDLLPRVSVVQRLLEAGFAVFLMDWRETDDADADWGLAEYAGSWLNGAATAIARRHAEKPIFIGHSLGGTFAAIFGATHPGAARKLLLIEAPLRFGPEAGALAAIVSASPPADMVAALASGAPGSLLDIASSASAPEEFVAGRWQDAAVSLVDPGAWPIHQRVIR